jgi:hypothetical protein
MQTPLKTLAIHCSSSRLSTDQNAGTLARLCCKDCFVCCSVKELLISYYVIHPHRSSDLKTAKR